MNDKRSLFADCYQRTVYCALHALTIRLQSTIINDFTTVSHTPNSYEDYRPQRPDGQLENNRLLKLLSKLTRRMQRLERNSNTLKFSKAFDLLIGWASQ